MRKMALALLLLAALFGLGKLGADAADKNNADKNIAPQGGATAASVKKEFGLEKRVPWITSRVIGTPDPPSPYRVEIACKNLLFDQPLAINAVPGSEKYLVAERLGKIFTFDNQPDTKAELLLDVGRTVYGATLHPKFARNGFIFVTSILDPAKEGPRGSRLSRFKLKSRDPLRADPASEEVLLEWPSGGHNGGCVRFGPDGYLYLGTGDGSGIADGLETGQDVSDVLGAILRIDVDHTDKNLAYAVPKDNPFVAQKGARAEIWAYGLRQPWRFSFDTKSGDLWAGEIGQDLWEEVLLVEKGGNYGWSVQESNHPFRPERPRGPTPILPPVVEHHHVAFRSITGGWVYHGQQLPRLRGAYIYGDYDTGKIWALRYADGKVEEHYELADTQLRIIDFGQDAAGEIVLLDFMGRVYRLTPAPPAKTALKFPQLLSETGLFSDTVKMVPEPGVISYSVSSALWSDGAHKDRLLALPHDSQIEFETVTYPSPAPGALPGWRFPDGAVLVKTFSLDMEAGNPASRRRLETRLLHYESIPGNEEVGAQVWHGYTYVWNDEQTDAKLLDTAGLNQVLTIKDAAAPGGERNQVWHYPSRAECALCHNMSAKYVLGINTLQMNRDHDYDGATANQLRTFEHIGLFTAPLPKDPSEMPRLAQDGDERQPVEVRARSYLHANCAHCHRKWGGGNADFQLLASQPLAESGTIEGPLGQGKFDLDDPRLIVPGDPARSMILFRMQRIGLGRMPHIASNVVDQQAVELVRQWIVEGARGELGYAK